MRQCLCRRGPGAPASDARHRRRRYVAVICDGDNVFMMRVRRAIVALLARGCGRINDWHASSKRPRVGKPRTVLTTVSCLRHSLDREEVS